MLKVKNAEQFDLIKNTASNQHLYFTPANYGAIFGRLDDEEKEVLLTEAIRLRKEDSERIDYRDKLAGNLNHEYDFIHMKNVLAPKVGSLVRAYEDQFSYVRDITVNQNHSNLDLTQLWVNFMQKGDFNPPHTHSGVFSFVVWLKIPYNLLEELNKFPKTRVVSASCFNFLITNTLGKITDIIVPVDKTWEGIICLFPSNMTHFVNPFFTSDEERISIAGNLLLQNKV